MIPHPSASNPVITPSMCTDVASPLFVADPFAVKVGSTFYCFHEVKRVDSVQQIAYCTSTDGLAWTYGAKILDATNMNGSTQLSYPMAFMVDGLWYMMVDCGINGITMIKATSFPTVWSEPVQILSPSYAVRDATLFQWNSNWYIFAWDSPGNRARLFWSANLLYGWAEHPSSPMYTGSTNSRPAGRPIIRDTSIDVFFQDNVIRYGEKVRCFRITTLSPTEYAAAEVAQSPLLQSTGSGWNNYGMHHLDRIDATLSIVDGQDDSGIFTIGVYQDSE